MKKELNNLFFQSPIMRWDKAIPLGNGISGCLVWGDGEPLKFSLDRADLWDNRPAEETLSKEFNYKKFIELSKEKNYDEIGKRFDQCYFKPTPTKIPAGRLEMTFKEKPENVESRLRLDTGTAEVTLKWGEKYAVVNTYLHAVKKFGWIRVKGDIDAPKISILPHDFGSINADSSAEESAFKIDDEDFNDSLRQLAYPERKEYEADGLKWFVQKTAEEFEYGIFMGEKAIDNGKDIVYYIGCSNDGETWIKDAKKLVKDALDAGYEEMLKSHTAWWKEFWGKSSISLPDKMFEKQWYLTNYLFGSCSRKGCPPMPLQGVWTADEGSLPPWKGDYHSDLNTQLSYWHYLKSNHIEEGESFIDFLWDLVPEAREFARTFFDAPGLCLPSVMTIKGKPLGGSPVFSLDLTNQIWLCQAFDMHWRYTGDDEFLKEKVYPYFKETALCVMRWLEPDEKGKLKLPLSSSPESHDGCVAGITPNSNFDLSLLIYLFKSLSYFSDVLKNDDKDMWVQTLEKLDCLCVNEKNVLMLGPNETLKESHRHHSHAMAIYPLRLLDYNSNYEDRKIIDATISNLEVLGTGLWVGYSFTWMAELYAVQENGEGAAYQLKLFWENFCSPNGFHLNGDYKKRGVSVLHYRPFTLEGNMCAADALQEMLLKTDGNVIRVFPAIPKEWKVKGASFNTLRGWNGILVSSEIKDEKVIYIELKASKDGEYYVHNNFDSEMIILRYANRDVNVDCEKDSNFKVVMKKGEECLITRK